MSKANRKLTPKPPPLPTADVLDPRWQPLAAIYQQRLDVVRNSDVADLNLEQTLRQGSINVIHRQHVKAEWTEVSAAKWGDEYKLEQGRVRYRYRVEEFQQVPGEFYVIQPERKSGRPPRQREAAEKWVRKAYPKKAEQSGVSGRTIAKRIKDLGGPVISPRTIDDVTGRIPRKPK